jgi:hypothetical protein
MSPSNLPVHEANLGSKPLRDLGLTIIGTPLDQILKDFQRELKQRGITRVLLRRLAERAETLRLTYPAEREPDVTVALTTFVTARAMNRLEHKPAG